MFVSNANTYHDPRDTKLRAVLEFSRVLFHFLFRILRLQIYFRENVLFYQGFIILPGLFIYKLHIHARIQIYFQEVEEGSKGKGYFCLTGGWGSENIFVNFTL